jgi:uncharacterized protein YabE (DUF348 family)
VVEKHRLRLAIIALTAIGLVFLGIFTLRKEITLTVNGKSKEYDTYALTVDQFLGSLGVTLGTDDSLQPPLDHWLNNKDQISLDRAVPVTIKTYSKIVHLLTAERVPSRLMALASLSIRSGDVILSSGTAVPEDRPLDRANAYQLTLLRAVSVTLQADGVTKVITTTASTLGQALWQSGIRLRSGDLLDPAASTNLAALTQPELFATFHHSQVLTIQADGKQIRILSADTTVGEALAEAGLSIQGLDYSLPSIQDLIPPDGQIRVVRVQEKMVVEQNFIPFKTVIQAASDVEIDTQKVIQIGQNGLDVRRIRVRLEDGKEVSRQVESEWVAVPPKNRIVGYGTQIVMHTLNTPNGTLKYWRALTMYATSYHPSDTGNITASGLPLQKGVVAVDTRYIPFYTQLYIPGYGKAVAADRGAGVVGRWIDLGYSDEDYEPWHQWVTVYFLWPPPVNIVWAIP